MNFVTDRYLKTAFEFQRNSPVESIFELFYLPERNTGLEDPRVSETRDIHADSIDRWKRDLNERQWQCVIEKMNSWFTTLGYTHAL